MASAIMVWVAGCKKEKPSTNKINDMQFKIDQNSNMLNDQDLKEFKWLNKPEHFKIEDNSLHMISGKGTDFFNNPVDKSVTATAPLLYKNVKGDFVATALVKPNFASMWNAASLMVHIDSTNWIKFAFENSDATGKSIVSVVTKGISDDANGVVLDNQESIWLRISRKGDVYAMHWSKDGKNYMMSRLCSLPSGEMVKVGMESQCPVGEPANHGFLYFSLQNTTIKDLRKGE